MDAQTSTTITRTAQTATTLPGGPSVTDVPRTGPAAWSRAAGGLRIPRHRAGACGAQQWMHTDTLR